MDARGRRHDAAGKGDIDGLLLDKTRDERLDFENICGAEFRYTGLQLISIGHFEHHHLLSMMHYCAALRQNRWRGREHK